MSVRSALVTALAVLSAGILASGAATSLHLSARQDRYRADGETVLEHRSRWAGLLRRRRPRLPRNRRRPPKIAYRGAEKIKGFMAAIWSWAPDISFKPTSVEQLGNTVVVEWTMEGTQTGPIGGIPASGKKFSVRGVSAVEIDQGKIRRYSDYYDLATLVVQFGVRFSAPPPPASTPPAENNE